MRYAKTPKQINTNKNKIILCFFDLKLIFVKKGKHVMIYSPKNLEKIEIKGTKAIIIAINLAWKASRISLSRCTPFFLMLMTRYVINANKEKLLNHSLISIC